MTHDETDTTIPDGTHEERSENAGTAAGGSSSDRFGRLSAADVRGLLDRVALAALVLLALIAGWNLYEHLGTAIRTWIDPAYQSIALAGLNLAVLLIALGGVVHQLRRIRSDETMGRVAPSDETGGGGAANDELGGGGATE
ncbi:hypothetical protein JCM18237_18450 [Halorubrum luteum]